MRRTKFAFLFISVCIASPQLEALAYTRPPASAKNGMVVTSQHIASDVGIEILQQGGNAIEAIYSTPVGTVRLTEIYSTDPNATPGSKIYSVTDTYPWGGRYPPQSAPVGNYLGSEAKGRFRDLNKPLENYDDGFITTAPVGTFPANFLGISDLGGNVNEWCGDWLDPIKKSERVTRGGTWDQSGGYNLSSSGRGSSEPSIRWDACGFRVVLTLPDSEQPSPSVVAATNYGSRVAKGHGSIVDS